MKKFINIIMSFGLVSIIGGIGFSLINSDVALAAGCDASGNVLGFPYWYRGLDMDTSGGGCTVKTPADEDGLKKMIGQIAVNIVEIVMVAVGYISFGFILLGGFNFITSLGKSDKMAAARTTIMNACIGLVIAISATAIIGSFVKMIPDGGVKDVTAATVVSGVLDIVYFATGAAAVIVVIIAGFTMIVSGDKPDSVAKARNSIIFASIGIVVIVSAKLITNFITGRF